MAPTTRALPFLLFVVLTVGMTWPVALHMEDSVFIDWDDTVHCLWAMAWNFHKFSSGLENFFDANIFHPYRNTLAFNENLIGQAVLAYPLYLLTGNVVLCHQVLLLLSFFLSAAGAYLLTLHLTANRPGAFVAGIAFSFCQYRFGNTHLLIELSTQWIPFTLLFMHRFLERLRWRDLVLCLLFYLLNFLSCLYYGVILSLFLGPGALVLAHRRNLLGNASFRRGAALFVFAAGLVLVPLLRPYVAVQAALGRETSVEDAIAFSPDLVHLLAPSSFQWAMRAATARVTGVQGAEMSALQEGLTKALRRFHHHESHLYVGLTVSLLAWLGMRRGGRTGRTDRTRGRPPASGSATGGAAAWLRRLPWILAGLVALFAWLTSKILLTFLAVFFLLAAGLVVYRRSPLRQERVRRFLESLEPEHRLYLFTAIWAFAFTFGPVLFFLQRPVFPGPWLPFSLIPGFSMMRHTFRMEAVAMLAVSVLAGYGIKKLLDQGAASSARRRVIVLAAALAILAENLSAPLPLTRIETGEGIPEVYAWIRENAGDDPIVEYPLLADAEVTAARIPTAWQWIWRVPFVTGGPGLTFPHDEGVFNWVREAVANSHGQYYSIYHWKRLVNGYSAFRPPPVYAFLRDRMASFPSRPSLAALQALGVRHLVLHRSLCTEQDLRRVDEALQDGLPGLRRVALFRDDELFEIEGFEAPGASAAEALSFRLHLPDRVGKGERVSANLGLANSAELPLILVPSVLLDLRIAVDGAEPSPASPREEITVTLPHVAEEGQEALVPFRFRAPPRAGLHRAVVSFRHPLSGESLDLAGELSVEKGVSGREDRALPLHRRIQRAVYLKTLMD